MQHIVPITAFSAEMLRTYYRTETFTFTVNRKDFILELLRSKRDKNLTCTMPVTTEVTFLLSDYYRGAISKDNATLAAVLYNYHVDEFRKYIYVLTTTGETIKEAVYKFYEVFFINEESFPYETALQSYQRWEARKNIKKSCVNTLKSEGEKRNNFAKKDTYSIAQLNHIYDEYLSAHKREFLNCNFELKKKLPILFKTYLYVSIGKRKTKYVAQIMNCPLRTVQHRQKAYSQILSQMPPIAPFLSIS